MTKKRSDRIAIQLRSVTSAHRYDTEKNRRNDGTPIALRKYDPTVRQHVEYCEAR